MYGYRSAYLKRYPEFWLSIFKSFKISKLYALDSYAV